MLLKNCSSWKNAQLFDVNVIYKICGKLVYYSKSNCDHTRISNAKTFAETKLALRELTYENKQESRNHTR